MTSIFLAQFFGVYLIIVSFVLLIRRKNIDLLFKLYRDDSTVLITGAFEVGLGLFLVLSHNIWELSWRGAITLFCWLILMRGFGRLAFPYNTTATLEKMERAFKKNNVLTVLMLSLVFIIGALFAYVGFTQ